MWAFESKKMSSKKSNVSGGGCKREIIIVTSMTCTGCLKNLTIWKVVELSKLVEISSIKKTFEVPTNISPAFMI